MQSSLSVKSQHANTQRVIHNIVLYTKRMDANGIGEILG
jgi:hypothetical protein